MAQILGGVAFAVGALVLYIRKSGAIGAELGARSAQLSDARIDRHGGEARAQKSSFSREASAVPRRGQLRPTQTVLSSR